MDKPIYEGRPLSAMAPIPKLPGYPQLWMWTALWDAPILTNTPENAAHLRAQGFTPSPYNTGVTETQLYKTARLLPVPGDNLLPSEGPFVEAWYKPTGRPLAPVLLTFSVESSPPATDIIPLLNPLPLPQIGEYGLVEQGNTLYPYHILSLPLEARQRWVTLGEKLKALSAPLMWPAFTDRHALASDENAYQRQLHSINVQQKLALDPTKSQLITQSARLQAVHLHIKNLQESLRKASWLQEWQEIQQMAQDLADDYHAHHRRVTAPQQPPVTVAKDIRALAKIQDAPPEPVEEKKKPGRRPRVPKTPIVAKGQDAVLLNSEVFSREIINALRDKSTYTPYPDQRLAEHRHTFNKDKGQLTITIRPLENEGFETVLHALNTLGDGCIDTYIAVTAIALEKNGTDPARIRTPFLISPDDILEVCGKQKSHGSYTPFQRADVIKHLKTLSQARVIAVMPGPGRRRGKRTEPTTIKAEGAIIDLLSFKIGEYSTITGEELWERRDISVGEWATMIPGLSINTASMLRQVLAYSAKNERYQKRLGIYLTLMFRINARHLNRADNTQHAAFPNDITMRALLEGAGIVPEKVHPARFRDGIMKALDDLTKQRDGKPPVVGNYWRVIDSSLEGQEREKAVREQAYGWLDLWLEQEWNFAPPESVLKQYRKMLKEAQEQGL
jgi:hypothetical protein